MLDAFPDSEVSPEVVSRVWAEVGGSTEDIGAEEVADELRAEEEAARESVVPAETAGLVV